MEVRGHDSLFCTPDLFYCLARRKGGGVFRMGFVLGGIGGVENG